MQADVPFEERPAFRLDLWPPLLLAVEVVLRRPVVHQREEFLVGHHLNHADGEHDSEAEQNPTVVVVAELPASTSSELRLLRSLRWTGRHSL